VLEETGASKNPKPTFTAPGSQHLRYFLGRHYCSCGSVYGSKTRIVVELSAWPQLSSRRSEISISNFADSYTPPPVNNVIPGQWGVRCLICVVVWQNGARGTLHIAFPPDIMFTTVARRMGNTASRLVKTRSTWLHPSPVGAWLCVPVFFMSSWNPAVYRSLFKPSPATLPTSQSRIGWPMSTLKRGVFPCRSK